MEKVKKREEALIVAITGGIGSGKSTVAKILKRKGFTVIFTDDIAKKVINKNKEVQQKLIKAFGVDTFIDGIYNPEHISDIVFERQNAKQNLRRLNQIVHPVVIDEMIKRIELLQEEQDDLEVIFVESALIFELNLEDGFDYTISVSATPQTRLERIISRTGLDEQQIKNRISVQMSQEEKNKLADFVIENEQGVDELKKTIDFILPIILSLPNKEVEPLPDEDTDL